MQSEFGLHTTRGIRSLDIALSISEKGIVVISQELGFLRVLAGVDSSEDSSEFVKDAPVRLD